MSANKAVITDGAGAKIYQISQLTKIFGYGEIDSSDCQHLQAMHKNRPKIKKKTVPHLHGKGYFRDAFNARFWFSTAMEIKRESGANPGQYPLL